MTHRWAPLGDQCYGPASWEFKELLDGSHCSLDTVESMLFSISNLADDDVESIVLGVGHSWLPEDMAHLAVSQLNKRKSNLRNILLESKEVPLLKLRG
jgi:hypothetical protein